MRERRVFMLLGIVLAVLALGLAYAAVSANLEITGNATGTFDADNFQVIFSKVTAVTGTKGVDTSGSTATIDSGDPTKGTFSFNGFTTKGQTQSATWTISNENDAGLSAYLELITASEINKEYFRATCNLADDVLAPNETTTVTITVECIKTPEGNVDGGEFVFSFEATSSAEEVTGGGDEGGDSGTTTASHNWQYTDSTLATIQCTCEECTTENAEGTVYTIGQTVSYTDDGAGSSSITGAKSGVTQGISDNNLAASDYGTNGSQTISKDSSTTWVVFGMEDTNGNGDNETLLLTTASPTSGTIELYGAAAYTYGADEVDRMCTEIYGTDARGMTIEDVNRTLGYTPAGGMFFNPTTSSWEVLNGFDTTFSEVYTSAGLMDDIKEYYETNLGKCYTPDYPNGTTDFSKLYNEKINGYVYGADSTAAANVGTGVPSAPATTAEAVKTMVFGSGNSSNYWLASRGVCAFNAYAFFGPGAVFGGLASSYYDPFGSNGGAYSNSLALRPIVSLASGIPE